MNGCHNRKPFVAEMRVQDGYQPDAWYTDARVAKTVSMPFRMAPDCQYTLTELGRVDKGCVGCMHKDHAHD